ncbi:MAG: hypothetical protein O2798_07305 [Chloroflexi bacterium]|nr:hypothetical protein [Chloroflexota bacterium]
MIRNVRRAAHAAFILLVMAVAAAYASEVDAPPANLGITTATPTAFADAAPDVGGSQTPSAADPGPADPESGGARPSGGALDEVPLYDPELVRFDVDCSLDFVSSGVEEQFIDSFVATHYVVDGVLGHACYGSPDDRLLDAWYWLRVVAPVEDLAALILFAGYDAPSNLFAYVEPLVDFEGVVSFQMTVNLIAEHFGEHEVPLTVAHEFTHVLTGSAAQLDRSVDYEDCETYFEGEGCYVRGSYIARWTEAFWGDWIDEIEPGSAEDAVAAEARCDVDDSFLGPYAATNPEEDFAETFAAYVYSVPVDSEGLLAKYEFMDADPELRSYRERVVAAGIAPFPVAFEGCG